MGLEIYMVGVIVEDMARAVEFYRRLGVDIPEETVNDYHVEVKMGKMTFFLTSRKTNKRWDPNNTEPGMGGYRMVLEFYLESRDRLDAKYTEMINYGYDSHLPPYITPFNMYFAMINDPDGNAVLLSSEVE